MRRIVPALLAILLALTGCGAGEASPRSNQMEDNDELIDPQESGETVGYMGDALRTSFFDMQVDEAYTCYEYGGVAAGDGGKLLVAEITLYNYTDCT